MLVEWQVRFRVEDKPSMRLRKTKRLAKAFGFLLAMAFIWCGPGAGVSLAKSPMYRLIDCINTALEKNPEIAIAKQELEAEKGVLISTRAVLYPVVNSSLRVNMENEDLFEDKVLTTGQDRVRFREDWTLQAGVEYTIFSGGENSNSIAMAELSKDVAYLKMQEKIHEVLFLLKSAFYEVLLFREEAQTQRVIIKLLEKERQRQQGLFEAGRTTKFNIIRTEVRLANERPTLIEAETRLKIAAIDLAEQMGLRWENGREELPMDIVGDLSCPKLAMTLDELIEKAQSRRPDYLRLDKLAKIEAHRAEVARSSNIPKLKAFATNRTERDRSGEDIGVNKNFFDNKTEFTAGLLGIWNIFDGFAGKGRAMEAEAKRLRFEIERDDSTRRIEFDVRRAYLRLKQAEKSLDTQMGNVEKALQSIELAKSSVEAGYGSQFDILQATVDYNTSRTIEMRSRFNYHLSLAELEKATFTRQIVVGRSENEAGRLGAVETGSTTKTGSVEP